MTEFSATDLENLESAEDFLLHFDLEFDPAVVHVNRLHILQRFHDYLDKAGDMLPTEGEAGYAAFRSLLARAYLDFVESDALTEKVFKVLKEAAKPAAFVALGDIAQPERARS